MSETVGRVPMAGKPMRVVFLVSSGGGNLRAVHCVAIGPPESGFAVVGETSGLESRATAWSRASGIATAVASCAWQDSAAFDEELTGPAPDRKGNNCHRVLGATILGLFEGEVVNLNYSEPSR